MRAFMTAVASTLCVIAVLALAWGVVLVATGSDDPDGARGRIGWLLTGAGAAVALASLAALWTVKRSERRARPLRG